MESRERLFEHLGMFLNAASSAAEFVHFFNANEWELESSLDETTLDFLYVIDARLHERADGLLDDSGLRSVLRADLDVFNRRLGEQPASTIGSFVDADLSAFIGGRIGFNRLLGNLELARLALCSRVDAVDAEVAAHRARLDDLIGLLTQLAREQADDAAIQRRLMQLQDELGRVAPTAGIVAATPASTVD